ncbi:MAG: ORF6N domain-containing protein [Bacteroidales bacterium]|nr:ORF6N domain-containing protein [Bacteroidales bacterium]MBN2863704.1 ORF6N domain-containing protein [Bacteroidales bacterium]
MAEYQNTVALPDETILAKIYMIRGKKVMLDQNLAELYQVETKQLKRAVRRNIERFPDDFMFELTGKEFEDLRCQIGTSNWESVRYAPMAFTELGVAMLSSVLNSEPAIRVNIQIMRTFTRIRELHSSKKEIFQKLELLEKKNLEQDEKILLIFKYLKQLEQAKQEEIDFKNRKEIGFKQLKKTNLPLNREQYPIINTQHSRIRLIKIDEPGTLNSRL